MMRSLWVSKSGMEAQQTQLDHISNNLANAATNGYKRSHAVFEDLIYQNMRQAGANSTEQTTLPTGLQVGLGDLFEPLGVDPKRVVDILSDSSGGPNMLKVRGGMIAQALAGEKNDMVTVNLATMRKDVKTMLAQGQLHERAMPLTTLALASFERASSDGLDAADCAQYPVWWLQHGSRG